MSGSLNQNPPNADRHITSGGSDWAWAVFALMLISDLVVIFWTFARPRGTRLFHQIAVIILTTATIAWFSMASDLGATPVAAEFSRGNTVQRQIWYVRYIQYFITFPLVLLELLLLTGLSFSDIFTTIFMAWVVVVTALVGALVRSRYKWGYYVFGIAAIFYIWWMLLAQAPRSSFAVGGAMRGGYWTGAPYLSFFLLLYPIAWACCEGGNVVSPTGEFIWYGILDIFTGPVFLFLLLSRLRNVDYGGFGFVSTKFSEGMGAGGTGTGALGARNMEAQGAGATTGTGTSTGNPMSTTAQTAGNEAAV